MATNNNTVATGERRCYEEAGACKATQGEYERKEHGAADGTPGSVGFSRLTIDTKAVRSFVALRDGTGLRYVMFFSGGYCLGRRLRLQYLLVHLREEEQWLPGSQRSCYYWP